ncbi:prostaglandin E2 receptor EP4 subtype-like [Ylistrum balloti]|uniref:prostaglandin E2 receptor EP4 subtype-like n=1 Tax=Ylistrum balloti TaxID=509963 RepID=UPI002905E515|nr:prostaglandin E2 receptor EP4 subtype-like [Ylistrum balloti]
MDLGTRKNFPHSDGGILVRKYEMLPMTTMNTGDILHLNTINMTCTFNCTTPELGRNFPVLPVAMMLLFGGSGNILALIILIHTSQRHKWRAFYRLVLALALSDLLGLLGPLPVSISAYVNNMTWTGGEISCAFMSFTLIFTGMTSAMLAAAMSLDRFLAVWFPFFYTSKLGKRWASFTIAALGILALVLACMPLMGINENVHQFPGTWCFFNQFATDAGGKLFSYLYASLGMGMVGMMVVLNTLVIVVLVRRRLLKTDHGGRVKSESRRAGDVFNVVFLVVLMMVFTICWLPLMVRIIINQSAFGSVDRLSDLLVMRLALTNQILDPWIYILLRKDFVSAVVNKGNRFVNRGSFLRRKSTDEFSRSGQRRTYSATS